MTDLIERLQQFNAKDGDVLVLTPPRPLTGEQLDTLGTQMQNLSNRFKEQGVEVNTVILPMGFDLKLIRTSELKGAVPALELEEAASQFAKKWEHESSSAQGAAHDAFIAGADFLELSGPSWHVQEFKIWKGINPDKPTWANLNLCSFDYAETNGIMEYLAGNNPDGVYRVTTGPFDSVDEPKTGLRMGDLLLHAFYEGGKRIRRASWPVGDHISADGAEGGTIWFYDADDDELVAGWSLMYHDLCAGDWEILG